MEPPPNFHQLISTADIYEETTEYHINVTGLYWLPVREIAVVIYKTTVQVLGHSSSPIAYCYMKSSLCDFPSVIVYCIISTCATSFGGCIRVSADVSIFWFVFCQLLVLFLDWHLSSLIWIHLMSSACDTLPNPYTYAIPNCLRCGMFVLWLLLNKGVFTKTCERTFVFKNWS